jgi:hypothetical protein
MTGATISNAELYGHWKLDDGNDSDEAADSGPRNEPGIIANHDIGGLSDDGSVWFDDPDRGTVLSLAGDGAWVSAGNIPIVDLDNDFTWNFWAQRLTYLICNPFGNDSPNACCCSSSSS